MGPKVYMWADILENMTWKEREHDMAWKKGYIFLSASGIKMGCIEF
ncbi:hypothetical protein [Methanobacterium ferruginis]|nr:hypothetical protein [Methanobacterium ferruginis]BDZ67841.1 hypothetical protein GCM10025860_12890 [Methanobacterium ferruginis]